MKKILILLLMSAVTVAIVFTVVPKEVEKTLQDKAPKLLEMNGYTVIKSNGFYKLEDQMEFIVKKNGKIDTLVVRTFRGQLSIQPR